MNQSINEILMTDAGKDYVKNLAMQPFGGTPDDLRAWIKIENERWGPIMKGITVPD